MVPFCARRNIYHLQGACHQGEITWGGNLPGKGFYLLESSFSWFCRAGIHSPRDSSQKIQPRVGSPPLKITCSTEPRETTLQQVEPRIWGGPGRAITEGLGACLPMLSPLGAMHTLPCTTRTRSDPDASNQLTLPTEPNQPNQLQLQPNEAARRETEKPVTSQRGQQERGRQEEPVVKDVNWKGLQ